MYYVTWRHPNSNAEPTYFKLTAEQYKDLVATATKEEIKPAKAKPKTTSEKFDLRLLDGGEGITGK